MLLNTLIYLRKLHSWQPVLREWQLSYLTTGIRGIDPTFTFYCTVRAVAKNYRRNIDGFYLNFFICIILVIIIIVFYLYNYRCISMLLCCPRCSFRFIIELCMIVIIEIKIQ